MKRLFAFFCLTSLLLMQACHEDPYLTVSPSSVSFPESGGSQTVRVSANYAWTASVSGSGFTVSPSSGEGEASVTITAAAASAADPVTGNVTFRSEGLSASVEIKQEAKTTITVGSVAKIPAEGGTVTVDIQYNTDYTVEVESSAQSWITYAGTKSLSSGKLTFEVKENETTDPRTGKVTVKDKSGKVSPITLTFEQEEKKVIEVGETMKIPTEGGTFEVDVKYNTDFTVEVEQSAQSWITFIQTKALKSGKLEFQFAANEGDERTGKVTVRDKSGKVSPITLTFVQEEEKKVIEVGETTTIPAEGGTFEIDVKYNTAFNVEVEKSAQSWITFIQTKAMKSGKLEFQFAANDKTESRKGKVTIQDSAGKVSPITLTFVQEKRAPNKEDTIKTALMEIYKAMDGKNWKIKNKWDSQKELGSWQGVRWNKETKELKLDFKGDFGLKGEFPDCFDGLSLCVHFWVQNEPGVTGTLPPSFNKLQNLESLTIEYTSMTSLSDVFKGMPLGLVIINGNRSMTGPIPETLGESDGLKADIKIEDTYDSGLSLFQNGFTGTVPESWFRLGYKAEIYENHLTGLIPDYFYSDDASGYWINNYINNWNVSDEDGYRKLNPFFVKDLDIPGYWPERGLKDVITGKDIPYKEIVSKSKATVVFRWASWCTFSAALLPQLKKMYEKYHDKGLEIIARPAWGDSEGIKTQKEFLTKNGYDKWYNFSSDDISFSEESAFGSNSTPFASVVDNKGNIIFSCSKNVSDPSRERFGHIASSDLIPFLEEIFGPLEDEDEYSSKDYSKDGVVRTLQKASVGKGINVVFMGDAYTDKDIASGIYDWLMNQSMEEFFAIEPYKSFRDRFNVYSVTVVSKNGRTGERYSTALGAVISNGVTISGSVEKCFEYALKVPEIKDTNNLLIGVLVNSVRSGGITIMSESSQSGVAFYSSQSNDNTVFGTVLRHEAGGHGFAFLEDEYSARNETAPKDYIDESNRLYKQYGWHANIDFTNDPKKVKWSAFLSDQRYNDEVGIFEGAANYTNGVYRPSSNSMMNQDLEYFNAPSRWAIYQRIMKLSGETPDFEKFLEYDAVNRKTAATAAVRPPMKEAANRSFEPTSPPVIIP